MALSKDKKRHPIEKMLDFNITSVPSSNLATIKKKKAKETRTMNFRIDIDLAEDFKIYCKLNYSDVTAEIISFINDRVKNKKYDIEEFKIIQK